MWLPFLLVGFLSLRIWAYQQLLEQSPAHYFASTDTPLTYTYTSEAFCTAIYSNSYSLTAWINLHVLPVASQEFLYIKTVPDRSSLQAMQNPGGSVTLNMEVCENTYAVSIVGVTLHWWVHIGIGLNYD